MEILPAGISLPVTLAVLGGARQADFAPPQVSPNAMCASTVSVALAGRCHSS